MSAKARQIFKDVLLVSAVFAAITGAYVGFAYAERYRSATKYHEQFDQEMIRILKQQGQQPGQ